MWRRLVLLLLSTVPTAATGQIVPGTRASLLVSADWLSAHLEDSTLVVLQAEYGSVGYALGHIPGARLVTLGRIVVTRDGLPNELPPVAQLQSVLEAAGVSDGSRIILYGDPLAAGRLFFTLDYLGMAGRTALLDGGLPAWKARGKPLSRETPARRSGRFTPRVEPGVLIDAAAISRRLGDTMMVLLDARTPAEWSGASGGENRSRAGHIPGAANLHWQLAVAETGPPYLKAPDVLATLFAQAGMAKGRELVVYCQTGLRASYLYFVARTLGYTPRLYDGSFIDWSRRRELPVSRR